jgi:enoyl-CoA hydratase/carnithine racemase
METHVNPTEPTAPALLRAFSGGILTLTLNRPAQYNALSESLLEALQSALDECAGDSAVRVVVIAGAGRAFSAGHDLKEMRTHDDLDYQKALFDRCSRLMLTIPAQPQPVIARVHGIATAAGCQLVAACDLAVASSDARFAVSGINVGLFCSTPSVALSRNVGRKEAIEMLLTGDFIDAHTARERGLVNRVVPAEKLDAEIEALAARIIAKSPVAIANGKRLFYRQLELGAGQAYGLAGEAMACDMMTTDAKEGIDAFIAKRAPKWQGR